MFAAIFSPSRRGHLPSVLLCLLLVSGSWSAFDLEIEGNDFFNNREIREIMAERPEELERGSLEAWRRESFYQMREAYREKGFYEARFQMDIRQDSVDSEDWIAALDIEEGPRYVFGPVKIVPEDSGISIVDSARLNARPGEPFVREALFKDKRFIFRSYGNAGFVRAEVEEYIDVNNDSNHVSVTFRVKPSYPVVFDTLIIRNRRSGKMDSLEGKTEHELIRNLLPYQQGDTVRAGVNENLIQKLQSTGSFYYVRLEDSLLEGSQHHSALVLTAEERVPGRLRSSLFFDTQYGFGAAGGVDHNNFSGSLNQVGVGAGYSQRKQSFELSYGSPLTMGLLLRFDNELDASWIQDESWHENRNMGPYSGDINIINRAKISRGFFYWLRAVSRAELDFTRQILPDGPADSSLFMNYINSAFVTFLDKKLNPTRGSQYGITWGNGGPIWRKNRIRITEFRHNWLELQSSYYYPLLSRLVVATRLDGGRFFGDAESNATRFYLGGSRSLRAFDFRKICPEQTPDNNHACLEEAIEPAYYLTSLELRYAAFKYAWMRDMTVMKYLEDLHLVPFVDYGKVWNLRAPFRWRGPGEAFSYGLGFRYPLLGVFNLRVDLAYGTGWFNSGTEVVEEDSFRLVIDLAQAF